MTSTLLGFSTGAVLGGLHGARIAALRFRAENTHRLPSSSKGWYLYHKSKNYTMMLSGLGESVRMGAKVGFWVGGFYVVEASMDHLRGDRRDVFSTVVAGLSVAGAFSAWSKFACLLDVEWGVY